MFRNQKRGVEGQPLLAAPSSPLWPPATHYPSTSFPPSSSPFASAAAAAGGDHRLLASPPKPGVGAAAGVGLQRKAFRQLLFSSSPSLHAPHALASDAEWSAPARRPVSASAATAQQPRPHGKTSHTPGSRMQRTFSAALPARAPSKPPRPPHRSADHFERLSDEIVAMILKELTVEEMLAATLTCRRWWIVGITHHKRFAYRLHKARRDKLYEEQQIVEERLLREAMQQRCYGVRKFAAGVEAWVDRSSRCRALVVFSFVFLLSVSSLTLLALVVLLFRP